MDAELSFVMTSYGQVQKGSVVYDPFVGTGSILLSCALRGAYCIGSDIDIRILKGKSDQENIWKNFEQYNLQRPEIVRTDNAIYHRHYRDHKPLYDAIICDPPYGIRAGARKTGSRKDHARPVKEEERHDHIPQTKPYPVSDVMSDLLDMASRSLVLGGRLVYVIPSFADFDPRTDLPQHECLQLVHSCYQPLSLELGRRIVVMKKMKEYDPSRRDHYFETIWVNGSESAEKCANLRDKIWENAKNKPGYEEKAAIRKRKRKEHLIAKKLAKRARQGAERNTEDGIL
jgi:tRNA (guanine10-N2)-methyltransferase